jgi:hypothetical protein
MTAALKPGTSTIAEAEAWQQMAHEMFANVNDLAHELAAFFVGRSPKKGFPPSMVSASPPKVIYRFKLNLSGG